MPDEKWRDEFQEYAHLLHAISSGDRSRALKLFGDYLLGAAQGDNGPSSSSLSQQRSSSETPGDDQDQTPGIQESNEYQDAHHEEQQQDLQPDDEYYNYDGNYEGESGEFAEEGDHYQPDLETYDESEAHEGYIEGEQQHEHYLPDSYQDDQQPQATTKRVRFAEEDYPLEQPQDDLPYEEQYPYDYDINENPETEYHSGSYDPESHEEATSTYDDDGNGSGAYYMHGALGAETETQDDNPDYSHYGYGDETEQPDHEYDPNTDTTTFPRHDSYEGEYYDDGSGDGGGQESATYDQYDPNNDQAAVHYDQDGHPDSWQQQDHSYYPGTQVQTEGVGEEEAAAGGYYDENGNWIEEPHAQFSGYQGDEAPRSFVVGGDGGEWWHDHVPPDAEPVANDETQTVDSGAEYSGGHDGDPSDDENRRPAESLFTPTFETEVYDGQDEGRSWNDHGMDEDEGDHVFDPQSPFPPEQPSVLDYDQPYERASEMLSSSSLRSESPRGRPVVSAPPFNPFLGLDYLEKAPVQDDDPNPVRPYYDDDDEQFWPFSIPTNAPWTGGGSDDNSSQNDGSYPEQYDWPEAKTVDPQYNVFEGASRFYTHYTDSCNDDDPPRRADLGLNGRPTRRRALLPQPRGLIDRIRERIIT
jgi:hypothetical protein